MFEVGRICLKIAGREAGKYCVVVKKIDENFVLVTGPKSVTNVKRRRCNVDHLEPTEYSIKIEAEASDKAVIEAYEKAGLLKKLGLKKPSPEIVKEAEKKLEKPKKEVKPGEKAKKPEKKEKVEKKEKKKSITIKIPSFRKPKKPEVKKEVKKPKEKIPKKIEKKKKPVKEKKTKKK